MFIKKDQYTGADTKTRFRSKKVIDWDATLTAWALVGVGVFVGFHLLFG